MLSRLTNCTLVLLALSACGGAEPAVDTTASALSTNCRELCRRYISLDPAVQPPALHNTVGRFFAPGSTPPHLVAEGFLIAAPSANNPDGKCSQGNVAVSSAWSATQPLFDILRDWSASAANAAINQCGSDFGL